VGGGPAVADSGCLHVLRFRFRRFALFQRAPGWPLATALDVAASDLPLEYRDSWIVEDRRITFVAQAVRTRVAIEAMKRVLGALVSQAESGEAVVNSNGLYAESWVLEAGPLLREGLRETIRERRAPAELVAPSKTIPLDPMAPKGKKAVGAAAKKDESGTALQSASVVSVAPVRRKGAAAKAEDDTGAKGTEKKVRHLPRPSPEPGWWWRPKGKSSASGSACTGAVTA
jgi:hypothetical protein